MNRSQWTVRAVATLLGLGLLMAAPQAQRRQPLPEASLRAVDGSNVALTAVSQEGQWVLLYVGADGSTPSTRLLEAITKWELGDALARVIIVVADTPDVETTARVWTERLPGARWFGDPKGDAARALKLRGAPTVVGARGQSLEWVLAGVLNDPTMLRDVIRSWVAPQ